MIDSELSRFSTTPVVQTVLITMQYKFSKLHQNCTGVAAFAAGTGHYKVVLEIGLETILDSWFLAKDLCIRRCTPVLLYVVF